eukprot:gnl/Dysnectes_brevis/125_a148_8704.p1 GENE.gnl/Dysnectes_brevis/125_a148_8704~~gnl/Dysnectes_brevis/125_a148_8704.p1  ORF type:complete len:155 (+),score=40.56 gnl/Dysnectes_brevis/125_a148_8704:138-602(+)
MARTKHTTGSQRHASKTPRKSLKAFSRKTIAAKSSAARKTASVSGAGVKKTRRYRPGTLALRQIRKLQQSADLQMPRASFQRLARALAQERSPEIRFQREALLALQEASESFLVTLLEDANLLAIHAKRVTLMDKDLKCLLRILRPSWYEQDNE